MALGSRSGFSSRRFVGRRWPWYWLLASFAAQASLGCGGSDPVPPPSPVEKCRDLLGALCTRLADCRLAGGLIDTVTRDADLTSCMNDTVGICESITAVTPQYGACLADISNWDCAPIIEAVRTKTVPELPQTCLGVLINKPSAGLEAVQTGTH
jgi:hypothetical protein